MLVQSFWFEPADENGYTTDVAASRANPMRKIQ